MVDFPVGGACYLKVAITSWFHWRVFYYIKYPFYSRHRTYFALLRGGTELISEAYPGDVLILMCHESFPC